MTLRPTTEIINAIGSDGINVYAEECALADKEGLRLDAITTLYDKNRVAIGCNLWFGHHLPVTIFGFTDE